MGICLIWLHKCVQRMWGTKSTMSPSPQHLCLSAVGSRHLDFMKSIQGWASAYINPPWINIEGWTLWAFTNSPMIKAKAWILLCSYTQLRLIFDRISNRVVACYFTQVVRFRRHFCSTTTCNSCWFINKRIGWKLHSVEVVSLCYCFINYCSFIILSWSCLFLIPTVVIFDSFTNWLRSFL